MTIHAQNRSMPAASPALERHLRSELGDTAEVMTDLAGRGRYATDASSYQVMPQAVVVPKTVDAALSALSVARHHKIPVTARGGGTSQCGQTINTGMILDASKHLDRILDLDLKSATCIVEPGIILDTLNRKLKKHGLWFPVDISTASRATIGGMAGNNSCGGRSLRYGTMRDNVRSIEATLPDGTNTHFGSMPAALNVPAADTPHWALMQELFALGAREADEVRAKFPAVQRRVGGYNLDALIPNSAGHNASHILVGSEGTLAFSRALELQLWPLIGAKSLGVCHFGSFHKAMESAQHIVRLKPIAVELVDATMLDLARNIPMFRPTLDAFVKGTPQALLLVEFAEDPAENRRRIKQLGELMGDLGFGWDREQTYYGGVVEVHDSALQAAITGVRTSGLNIMMSMKDARKPVSFVEDCAVPLTHLAEYTAKLTEVFERHGTRGTWYAHASEGCLHVRPVLNLKLDKDRAAMRAIAEEAFALVRAYKGSHSGEHGDGIVRSEFHEAMFGSRLTRAFETVKTLFDPENLMNPGRIVRAPKFDDPSLLRFGPHYSAASVTPALDWSEYSGPAGGLQGAIEMCNNNGACRALDSGSMCPSYRVTRDEVHVTRGRANTLRLALSGQLGDNSLASDDVKDALTLCVSCKACKRECPTGVDMARLKIEALAARARVHGLTMRDRFVAYLPRYAPVAAKFSPILNLRNKSPALARIVETLLGLSAERPLPQWRKDTFAPRPVLEFVTDKQEVVLFADTFNRTFERERLEAALKVLQAAGCFVHHITSADASKRPLCCGRTFLSVGAIDQARFEATRSINALAPFAARGVPIIGLEPSCVMTFRDEIPKLLPTVDTAACATQVMLLEEFLATNTDARQRLQAKLKPIAKRALLHGHCHQKAFDAMGAVEKTLRLVPELRVETIQSSCCGMAGAFGYQAETIAASKAMAELSLLPAVRQADKETLIVADGTSCRHQIADGTTRRAIHVAEVLASALL
jgi:FAD/FMN-containing dehydrogenase/Fe-S oxidoreductase